MKPAPPETIRTDHLILKKHEVSFASEMFETVDRNRLRLSEFLPWVATTQTIEDEVKYVRWTRSEWIKCNLFDYSVFLINGDVYLGNMGFHSLDWGLLQAEIGYWISHHFEGMGLVSEAVHALTCEGFEIGLENIEIRCAENNLRSKTIPQRLGYHYEGVKEIKQDGKLRNTHIYVARSSTYERSFAIETKPSVASE